MTEAQKKAQRKYLKTLHQINIRFFKGEEDLYEYVRSLSQQERKEVFKKALEGVS